jgi:MTH538 TIR-like domain (DUF1863)
VATRRYDGFITYSHAADETLAPALQHVVQRLAKPWYRPRRLHLYRDRTGMGANPDLWGTIRSALDDSDWLIVLCSESAASSQWVADEIKHWRQTRAALDGDERILLAITDREYTWDKDKDVEDFDWSNSSAVPRALSGAFARLPFIVDLRPFDTLADGEVADDDHRPLRDREGFVLAVAPLAAAIHRKSVDDLMGEERRQHRRSRRTAWLAAATLAVLAVVATGLGIVAVLNARQADARRAQAERSEEHALGQAEAAEALLAATDSPALAIDRVVSAAGHSDRPTIRSAMLAVANEARGLRRALTYHEDEAGHPAEGALFTGDGTGLMAWGPAPAEGSSFVQIWDVESGQTEFAGTVEVADIEYLVRLNVTTLAACVRDGPVTIDLASESPEVTVLDHDWSAVPDKACHLAEYAAGVLAHAVDDGDTPDRSRSVAYTIDRQGRTTRYEGINSSGGDPASRIAVLAGSSGLVVVTPERAQRVTTEAVEEVEFADAQGRALLEVTGGRWAALEPGPTGHRLRDVAVPQAAVAVAPVLDFGRMTGDVAWIEADGTVSWTRDTRQVRLDDPGLQSGAAEYQTTLEPLADESLVAVFRNSATLVRPPTGSSAAQIGGAQTDWAVMQIEPALGSAPEPGTDPILGRCRVRNAVVLPSASTGSLLVGTSAQTVALDARGLLGPSCSAFDVGDSLSAVRASSTNPRVTLRENLVFDGLTIAPETGEIAVHRSGRPIEILYSEGEKRAPAWTVRTDLATPTAIGFGQRLVSLESTADGGRVLIVDIGADTERIETPEDGVLVSVRPDGGEVIAQQPDPDGLRTLVRGERVTEVDAICGVGELRYAPAAGFETSLEAAEAQIPVVVHDDGTMSSCRDGDTHQPGGDGFEIVSYDMNAERGRIVSRTDGRPVVITSWTRGDEESLASTTGPDTSSGEAQVRLDEEGDVVATRAEGSQEIVVHGRADDRWQRLSMMVSGLRDIVDIALIDHGTLVLVVSELGGFELYDASSGRLLAEDPMAANPATSNRVTGISASTLVNDQLYVRLAQVVRDSGARLHGALAIEMPIGIDPLMRQLCAIYAAPECPTDGLP